MSQPRSTRSGHWFATHWHYSQVGYGFIEVLKSVTLLQGVYTAMVKDPYKEWDSGHFCALLVDLGVPCDKK